MITTLVLNYAVLKSDHLAIHHNPDVSSFEIDTKFDDSNPINLTTSKIRPAFGFYKFLTDPDPAKWRPTLLDDSRYVKLVVQAYGEMGSKENYKRQIPYHKCTSEDLAEYNPLGKD